MTSQIRIKPLALTILAAIPVSASALQLGDGEGQALIFPYYTVNAGLTTMLQVSNHRDEVKALNVRFLEGNNGRTALNFNVYLKPRDTWTAALIASGSGEAAPARIVSADDTCTVPAIPSGGEPFRNFGYTLDFADGGSASFARTREGHFEIIEMGVVSGALGEAAASGNCTLLRNAWVPEGTWDAAPGSGIAPPSGGLSGSAAVIEVELGVIYSYRPTAIDRFSGIHLHHPPGKPEPNLASAAGDSADGVVTATWVGSAGEAISASWPRAQAIDAVSALLSRVEISNRFTEEAALEAASEWILNFPTKPYYTDSQPGGAIEGDPLPPFGVAFSGEEPLTEAPVAGGACTFHPMEAYDRDGVIAHALPSLCLPGDPSCGSGWLATCHVTQTVSLGQVEGLQAQSPLLGSLRKSGFYLSTESSGRPSPGADAVGPVGEHESGYATIRFEGAMRPSLEGVVVQGLPVIALGLKRIVNNNALPGRIANYAAALPHSGRSEVVVEED